MGANRHSVVLQCIQPTEYDKVNEHELVNYTKVFSDARRVLEDYSHGLGGKTPEVPFLLRADQRTVNYPHRPMLTSSC